MDDTTTTTPPPNNNKTILVTGGCGYIGSHTITILIEHGYNVVIVDNLSNSTSISLDRVAKITGLLSDEKERNNRMKFYQVDLCDMNALRKVFEEAQKEGKGEGPPFHACIHFAGLKAVGESTKIPLKYYHNNLTGTFHLLELMDEFQCHSLVFSSSATVYGAPDHMPVSESEPVGLGITNAYGRTKFMIEEILKDFYKSKKDVTPPTSSSSTSSSSWSITLLRYFNPVGAHPSGLIGEDPNGPPNNLMPYVSQVAVGRREFLSVFGNDYDTHDGTGIRDYIHVMDLARGHLDAIQYMESKKNEEENKSKNNNGGLYTFNLGTGTGYSVLDMVKAMEKACGHKIAYKVVGRREGDVGINYADATLAKKEMKWEAKLGLDEMCRDLWCWQLKNPQGFSGPMKED